MASTKPGAVQTAPAWRAILLRWRLAAPPRQSYRAGVSALKSLREEKETPERRGRIAKLLGAASFARSTAARAISSKVEGTVEAGLVDTTPKTRDMI